MSSSPSSDGREKASIAVREGANDEVVVVDISLASSSSPYSLIVQVGTAVAFAAYSGKNAK